MGKGKGWEGTGKGYKEGNIMKRKREGDDFQIMNNWAIMAMVAMMQV